MFREVAKLSLVLYLQLKIVLPNPLETDRGHSATSVAGMAQELGSHTSQSQRIFVALANTESARIRANGRSANREHSPALRGLFQARQPVARPNRSRPCLRCDTCSPAGWRNSFHCLRFWQGSAVWPESPLSGTGATIPMGAVLASNRVLPDSSFLASTCSR